VQVLRDMTIETHSRCSHSPTGSLLRHHWTVAMLSRAERPGSKVVESSILELDGKKSGHCGRQRRETLFLPGPAAFEKRAAAPQRGPLAIGRGRVGNYAGLQRLFSEHWWLETGTSSPARVTVSDKICRGFLGLPLATAYLMGVVTRSKDLYCCLVFHFQHCRQPAVPGRVAATLDHLANSHTGADGRSGLCQRTGRILRSLAAKTVARYARVCIS